MNVIYKAGQKVFHKQEKKLTSILNIYSDPINGDHGDMRLELTGNTSIADFEPYNKELHSAFDGTFTPLSWERKAKYGIISI